jgi:hypothetical protein
VDWLRRIRRAPRRETLPAEPEEIVPPPVPRASPGLAAVFAGLREDGSHGVLDLGPAVDANLRLYGRYARWVRFGSLLHDPPGGEAWKRALQTLPPLPDRLYDVVMVWDLLDRLSPRDRPVLIERLSQLTGPGARLYVIVDASGQSVTHPLRFTLHDVDQVSQEIVGPPRPAYPPILPAEVERTLAPFQVAHAFTLRGGLREYVAHWQGRDPRATTWWTR